MTKLNSHLFTAHQFETSLFSLKNNTEVAMGRMMLFYLSYLFSANCYFCTTLMELHECRFYFPKVSKVDVPQNIRLTCYLYDFFWRNYSRRM